MSEKVRPYLRPAAAASSLTALSREAGTTAAGGSISATATDLWNSEARLAVAAGVDDSASSGKSAAKAAAAEGKFSEGTSSASGVKAIFAGPESSRRSSEGGGRVSLLAAAGGRLKKSRIVFLVLFGVLKSPTKMAGGLPADPRRTQSCLRNIVSLRWPNDCLSNRAGAVQLFPSPRKFPQVLRLATASRTFTFRALIFSFSASPQACKLRLDCLRFIFVIGVKKCFARVPEGGRLEINPTERFQRPSWRSARPLGALRNRHLCQTIWIRRA